MSENTEHAIKPFRQYKKVELLEVVQAFGVELKPTDDKNMEIIKRIKDDGVTEKDWEELKSRNVATDIPVVPEVPVEESIEDNKTESSVELVEVIEEPEVEVIDAPPALTEVAADPVVITEPSDVVIKDVQEVEATTDDLVLVKMTRNNYSYEARGYQFSRSHPFGLVKEEDADFLIEEEGGFQMASPSEARNFYK